MATEPADLTDVPRAFSAVRRDDTDDGDDHGVVIPERADGSPLDLLRTEVQSKASQRREPLHLVTDDRPGFGVTFKTALTLERLEAWQKISRDTSYTGGINPVKLACIALSNLCLEITAGDKTIADSAGRPVTFASKELLDMLHTDDPLDAVKHWYGADDGDDDATDGPLLVAFGKVITACGYDEDAVTTDPTRRRSRK